MEDRGVYMRATRSSVSKSSAFSSVHSLRSKDNSNRSLANNWTQHVFALDYRWQVHTLESMNQYHQRAVDLQCHTSMQVCVRTS